MYLLRFNNKDDAFLVLSVLYRENIPFGIYHQEGKVHLDSCSKRMIEIAELLQLEFEILDISKQPSRD